MRTKNLGTVEKEHVLKVLRLMNYNRADAAKVLGIHKNTLYNLLKRYGIKLKRIY